MAGSEIRTTTRPGFRDTTIVGVVAAVIGGIIGVILVGGTAFWAYRELGGLPYARDRPPVIEAGVAPMARPDPPRPPDFAILEWSIVPGSDGGKPRVVGELKNNGSVPMGVELQVVVRDAAGRIVRVNNFWPASVKNIEPGDTYAFSTFMEVSPDDTAEVRIVRGMTW